MPTQQEHVLARMKIIQAMIRDRNKIDAEKFFAWCYVNIGLTQRTCAQYLKSLALMDIIKIDQERKEISWIG